VARSSHGTLRHRRDGRARHLLRGAATLRDGLGHDTTAATAAELAGVSASAGGDGGLGRQSAETTRPTGTLGGGTDVIDIGDPYPFRIEVRNAAGTLTNSADGC